LRAQLDDLARITAQQGRQIDTILKILDQPQFDEIIWDWETIPEFPSLLDLLRAATFAFGNRLTALQWLAKPNSRLDNEDFPILHGDSHGSSEGPLSPGLWFLRPTIPGELDLAPEPSI
jgi:hypothetical protein